MSRRRSGFAALRPLDAFPSTPGKSPVEPCKLATPYVHRHGVAAGLFRQHERQANGSYAQRHTIACGHEAHANRFLRRQTPGFGAPPERRHFGDRVERRDVVAGADLLRRERFSQRRVGGCVMCFELRGWRSCHIA